MKKITDTITEEAADTGYPLTRLAKRGEDILFIDIETTGLSPRSAVIYMIGSAYYDGTGAIIRQWFSDSEADEVEILRDFMIFAVQFRVLVHFNGDRFDLPFIDYRCRMHGIANALNQLGSVDIYRRISPYKNVLGLPDCKQKTVELFLGIDRQDKYTGGELVKIYKRYLASREKSDEELLTLHNADDLRGMLKLLPVLTYYDFFRSVTAVELEPMRTDGEVFPELSLPVRAGKVQANTYKGQDGAERQEILLKGEIPVTLPSSVGANVDGCYFKISGSELTMKMPLYETELKYFYSNYHDYYYLPAEDQALHKSIAGYVDKSHRIQATASNCYTRKEGRFLRQFGLVFTPFFKADYEDDRLYFELSQTVKASRSAMALYAAHVLAHILKSV